MLEKPEELFVGYVAQKAIIEVDGKVLFVKSNSDAAKWDLPGGRLHHNESPEEGLLRELQEELSVECRVGDLVCAERFIADTHPMPFYFVAFAVDLVDDAKDINIPADELSLYTWLPRSDILPETVYDNCVSAVTKYFDQKQ